MTVSTTATPPVTLRTAFRYPIGSGAWYSTPRNSTTSNVPPTVSGDTSSTRTVLVSTALPSTSCARSKLRRASLPGQFQLQLSAATTRAAPRRSDSNE